MNVSFRRWAIGLALFIVVASGLGVFLWHRSTTAARVAGEWLQDTTNSSPAETGAGAAVQLTAEEQQQIDLQVTEVRRESLTDEISTIGRVQEPESALSTVSTRYGGRIDRLFANSAGQPIQKGDPVATITVTGQPILTPGQNDDVVTSLQKPMQITVSAPASGIVKSRKVSEGQFVNPGDSLIELTNLSAVWVEADVFDFDIGKIQPGLSAEISSEALPASRLRGKVTLIEPYADPQARTTPVRIHLDNPGMRLKPGMIVQTHFQIPTANALTVPSSAIIDTGMDKVVYVAHDNGVFERRSVHVGTPIKDRYPVTEGLKSGDKVVTNGTFLIDSQTRLTGGMTGMFGGSKSFSTFASASEFKTTFRIDPDPPAGGKDNSIQVTVVDRASKPVTDAQVRLTFIMPAMPSMGMAEMRNSADLKWDGKEYSGPFHVTMAGPWNVVVEARRGDQPISIFRTNLNAR